MKEALIRQAVITGDTSFIENAGYTVALSKSYQKIHLSGGWCRVGSAIRGAIVEIYLDDVRLLEAMHKTIQPVTIYRCRVAPLVERQFVVIGNILFDYLPVHSTLRFIGVRQP